MRETTAVHDARHSARHLLRPGRYRADWFSPIAAQKSAIDSARNLNRFGVETRPSRTESYLVILCQLFMDRREIFHSVFCNYLTAEFFDHLRPFVTTWIATCVIPALQRSQARNPRSHRHGCRAAWAYCFRSISNGL